jgi:GT2 family glycosyltransferase
MRVLVYTSSMNGRDSLHACINSVLNQTYPVEKILVVDNASSDGSCLETFPEEVTLICHLRNLGTSGAAATAFEVALSQGYDWIWVLDQDTVPDSDALYRLVELYHSFSPDDRAKVGIICSEILLDPTGFHVRGRQLSASGMRPAVRNASARYYDCDAVIWSGALFKVDAIRAVGQPRFGSRGCWEDLGLDYGDIEYSYRIKQAGYRVLQDTHSRIIHPIGKSRHLKLGPAQIYSTNHNAFRRYLYARNMVYFWLYLFPTRNRFGILFYLCYRLVANSVKMILFEKERGRKLRATWIGTWDGFRKRLDGRRFSDLDADEQVQRYRSAVTSSPRPS